MSSEICKNCRYCLLYTTQEGEAFRINLCTRDTVGKRLLVKPVHSGDHCEKFAPRRAGDVCILSDWMEAANA